MLPTVLPLSIGKEGLILFTAITTTKKRIIKISFPFSTPTETRELRATQVSAYEGISSVVSFHRGRKNSLAAHSQLSNYPKLLDPISKVS